MEVHNKVFKEAKFFETDRRGRDQEPGQRGCAVAEGSQTVKQEVPHSCVVYKIRRDTLGAGKSQP